jgi:hypothetical protein
MRTAVLTCVLVAAAGLCGCRSTQTPTLDPGPLAAQRYDAQRYDPLPEPDTAPEIVGARGREYDRPVAQPSRARWNPRTWMKRIGF